MRIDWLAKLGEVTINWGELTMAFKQGEKAVVIRAAPTLVRKIVAPEALSKMKEVGAVMLVWTLGRTKMNKRKIHTKN